MSTKPEVPTGMILAGIFATENIDTSGESISLKGLDCSAVDAGEAVVNYEHKNENNSINNGEEIVGKVISAKKIYKKEDCTTELERKAWEEIQLPLLFGYIRLFDGAGHSGAKALAAAIRDQHANKEKILLRWSVDGHTVTRSGSELTSTILKRMSATWKPANRAVDTTLIADPHAPDGFKKDLVPKKEFPELEDTIKFENPEFIRLASSDIPLEIIDSNDLKKAIDAGGYNVAPDQLSGGAALQVESIKKKKPLKERVKDVLSHDWGDKFDKSEVRALIKASLPEVSDEYIQHFEDAINDLHIKRSAVKKSEGNAIVSRPSIFKLHQLEINLRKNIEELKVNSLTDAHMPCVYKLFYKVDGQEYIAGRFMLYNNKLVHLEDYYGLLNRFLPEGPLDFSLVSQIYYLRNGSQTRIETDPTPLGIENPDPVPAEISEAVTRPQTRPPSVFDYMRSGMDTPHVFEINNGVYYLDGNKLTDPEVKTIYANAKNGVATLRYRQPVDQLGKMEAFLTNLIKAEGEIDPASALSHVRNAVAAGHLHPDVERALTRHLYSDPRTGHGNKLAWSEFRKQNKPGAHVALDINGFKNINDAFSHDVGDQAIKTFFGHVHDAANEVAPGANKIFTPSGDEGYLHFPSQEHASKFARALTQRLEATPPIHGVHKLSTTIGFGDTPENADKASLMAKEQKYLPGQEGKHPREKKGKFPVGQIPNLAHSLVPGREGPVPIHDPTPAAIKHSIPEVKKQSEARTA